MVSVAGEGLAAAQVAIIIPCFNTGKYLRSAVTSVLRQTTPFWQLIIVDDGSTDDSLSIARAMSSSDPRITVVSTSNRGVCAARNVGASMTTAPNLLFLDADDELEPTMLQSVIAHLRQHQSIVGVYTGHTSIDDKGVIKGVPTGMWPWTRLVASRYGVRTVPLNTPSTPFCSIFLVAAIIPSLCVVDHTAFDRVGRWDEDFGQGCEDTDLFLRLRLVGDIHYINTPLVRYRHHDAQDSASNDFAAHYDKLTQRWRLRAGNHVVQDAFWFREHRFYPRESWRLAGQELRRKRVPTAVRLGAAALRSYRPSRPPTSTTTPLR